MKTDLNDLDEVVRVRKVINDANINGYAKVVYTIDNEDNSFNTHSLLQFLFVPQIPSLPDYLRANFGSFFAAKQYVYTEVEKLRLKEQGRKLARNVSYSESGK